MSRLGSTPRVLGLAAAFLGVGCSAVVSIAGATGSGHDFADAGWSGGESCVVCHTPHWAKTPLSDSPLWNHQVTLQTFTVYSSPTLTARDVAQPRGSSKICLSCHDGSVALNSFGGVTGATFIGAGAMVGGSGGDLRGDHPVSFTYDSELAERDGRLSDPATAPSGLGGTIAEDMLTDWKMECTSCHNVHESTGAPSLLHKSNAGSALCLTCHRI